jgi:hypothetical protein
MHAQAVHHTRAVNLDCAHTDTEIEGNDLVWLPGHQRLENLALAWTERIDQRCRSSNFIGSALRGAGLSADSIAATKASWLYGFSMKSTAPAFIARTAVCTSP